MKTKLLIMLFLYFLTACDKENYTEIKEFEGKKWKVIGIIDKETGQRTSFPSEAKNFELIFRTEGRIKLLNMCNYAYGKYSASGNVMQFEQLGPSTKRYCNIIYAFEDLFMLTLLQVKSYELVARQMILNSETKKIVMEYAGEYDLSTGKVLFCTNAHTLNCLFEIEIFIGDKKMETITSASQYNDIDCTCSSPPRIGVIFPLKEGEYAYTAKNVKCEAKNVTSEWKGKLKVRGDHCTTIFLDVEKK